MEEGHFDKHGTFIFDKTKVLSFFEIKINPCFRIFVCFVCCKFDLVLWFSKSYFEAMFYVMYQKIVLTKLCGTDAISSL